jgi:pimeloyl-ACP methyl ester carboxylesterase
MQLTVNGASVYAATGGRPLDPALPLVVFLHGAGLDHSVWALLARWFAHHGNTVLAPDLPGHGRSDGAPLTSIGEMVSWTEALIKAAGASSAAIVGHSMGSLIALALAARSPERVSALGLVAAAPAMPVSPELLNAARANDHAAIDMVTIWGFGFAAGLGGSLAPGAWMSGGGSRLLERANPGVLFADLNACNAYGDGLAAAGKVRCRATLVLGERDLMTPAKAGRQLAAALPDARAVVLPGAGHMLMSERPDDVLAALKDIALREAAST